MDKVNFKKVEKILDKIPHYIRDKLFSWSRAVELEGIEIVRKISGYHDEPLKGKRRGQRSIRLSKSYRAIYKLEKDSEFSIIEIIEVSNHDY